MRKKLPILTAEERKEKFKECIFSLDPAVSLDSKFINGIESFKKRHYSQTAEDNYFRLSTNNFKNIEAKVSSTGTRIYLKLKSFQFEEKVVWYSRKSEKNANAIEVYVKFKEAAMIGRTKEEERIAARKEIEEKLAFLRNIVKEKDSFYIQPANWGEDSFNVSIYRISEQKAEIILQKIKDLV